MWTQAASPQVPEGVRAEEARSALRMARSHAQVRSRLSGRRPHVPDRQGPDRQTLPADKAARSL